MKKILWKIPIFCIVLVSFSTTSCIGSFSLTKKVVEWNGQVGSKFINELVFFAFWILPVYEVTALSDLLVLNSIEFWSGKNPTNQNVSEVKTEHGTYIITRNETGYVIESPNGFESKLEFSEDDQTWSLKLSEEEVYPFMTMIDSSHVKMITPDGSFQTVELSQEGLMAYSALTHPY